MSSIPPDNLDELCKTLRRWADGNAEKDLRYRDQDRELREMMWRCSYPPRFR